MWDCKLKMNTNHLTCLFVLTLFDSHDSHVSHDEGQGSLRRKHTAMIVSQ